MYYVWLVLYFQIWFHRVCVHSMACLALCDTFWNPANCIDT